MAAKWRDLSRRVRRAAAANKGPVAGVFGLIGPLAVTVSLVPARASLAGAAAALILVAVIAAVAIPGDACGRNPCLCLLGPVV